MARPPKYASEDEKPISVTLRLPRDLYDQAQQHAKRRQTTLTELVREGLQMRLETPTDPRDILATQDITVMQELRQMIAEEVQVALAVHGLSTSTTERGHNSNAQHYSNATMQGSEASGESPVPQFTPAPTRKSKKVAPESGPAPARAYESEPGNSLVTEPVPMRKGGRPRSALGQQILDLLTAHPEGLSAEQIRGHLAPGKPIGDTLAGMRHRGTVRTQGQGRETRYFASH